MGSNGWIPVLIVTIWVVASILKRLAKSASKQGLQNNTIGQQNPQNVIHQPSTNPGGQPLSLQDFIDLQRLRGNLPESQTNRPAVSLESTRSEEYSSRTLVDELAQERSSHYSEEQLVQNYERQHNAGGTITHHGGHPLSHTGEEAYDRHKDKTLGGQKDEGVTARKQSKLKALLGGKQDFRRALILKEILERKYS